jgi:phosphatidylethanolamine-binding protein (PEBP) family uncharacterized protein
MSLTTPAFNQNCQIPSKYTCEGDDMSPPLAWDGVPEGAKSLVLIIDVRMPSSQKTRHT